MADKRAGNKKIKCRVCHKRFRAIPWMKESDQKECPECAVTIYKFLRKKEKEADV